MNPGSVRNIARLGLLLVAFAGVAVAVEIPNPPPQTAIDRAQYNDLIVLGDPGGTSSCCGNFNQTPNGGGGGGCDDPACEQAVCSFDPFCCDQEWDEICVNEALDVCTVCGGGSALAIPAASNWGLAALSGALLAGGMALLALRRQKRT